MSAEADEPRAVTLEELQGWIGQAHDFAGADDVSKSDIRRKLEVYCFDCPLHYDDEVARAHGYRGLVAPVAMTPLWAMPAYWRPGDPVLYRPGVREQAGGIRTDVPVPAAYTGGVNTATQWEYFEPLYPGDALHGNWRLVEIKPRETRLGDGVFVTVEATIYKRSGELVAKNRNTHYRFTPKQAASREKTDEPRASAARAETPGAAAPTSEPADWSGQLRFADVAAGDEVPPYSMWLSYQRIVMSVAADRMFSGLHHNRDTASGRGFADIIFNTRGWEMLFETVLRRWIGLDGRIRKLGPFRMTGSSYPGDVVTAQARVVEKTQSPDDALVKVELLALNDRGEAGRGEAQVALPA
ncbi:MAG TPA: MaoC family dehydratase N-terminal domain-containing protein [Stellaceae bacterium]|nr:MaoC family dehydratase N-terminal domain-containing protein [Stellaceae bacterium]